MARETATYKRSTESRLIFTILGVTVWVATGFLVGLVAGVVSEEPQLLAGHLTGQDTEIEWTPRADASPATGGSAAGTDVAAAPRPSAPLVSSLDRHGASAVREPGATPSLEAPSSAAIPLSARPQKDPATDTPAARPLPKGPGYLIQVGAYSTRDAAQEVAETLRGKGYAVEVLSAADDGRFRVRVGPVAARDRAEGLAKRLEDDEGLPTWILRARES